jgi:hypothetical protein
MAFERFISGCNRGPNSTKTTVRIGKEFLNIPSSYRSYFADVDYVDFYIDKEQRLVGIKPAPYRCVSSYKIVRRSKDAKCLSVYSRSLFAYLHLSTSNSYFAEWDADKNMIVIDLDRPE